MTHWPLNNRTWLILQGFIGQDWPAKDWPILSFFLLGFLPPTHRRQGGHAFAAADAKCLPFINEWLRRWGHVGTVGW